MVFRGVLSYAVGGGVCGAKKMKNVFLAAPLGPHDAALPPPPQTQVGIRQNADAFLASTIGFLKAARFENHGGVPRIVGGHSSRELCALGHSAAGLRASLIRCWCSNLRAVL